MQSMYESFLPLILAGVIFGALLMGRSLIRGTGIESNPDEGRADIGAVLAPVIEDAAYNSESGSTDSSADGAGADAGCDAACCDACCDVCCM